MILALFYNNVNKIGAPYALRELNSVRARTDLTAGLVAARAGMVSPPLRGGDERGRGRGRAPRWERESRAGEVVFLNFTQTTRFGFPA